MIDAPTIPLFPKLCRHNVSNPIVQGSNCHSNSPPEYTGDVSQEKRFSDIFNKKTRLFDKNATPKIKEKITKINLVKITSL